MTAEFEKLFSYGTLRYDDVQLATFGRKLNGKKDALSGYSLSKVKILDKNVVATSGEDVHPVALYTGDEKDQIDGIVFDVSALEIAQSDKYEVADYKRVKCKLASGISAWVYVSANIDRHQLGK